MNDKLHQAFDSIKAEEHLKENTLSFLQKESNKISRQTGSRIMKTKQISALQTFRRYVAFATSLLFLLFAGSFSFYLYFSPVTYIDVDINPSIGFSVNQFERIINTYSYNRKGEELLSSVDIKYRSYEDAISLLMNEMEQENYLTSDGLLSITLQSGSNAEHLLQKMKISVETLLDEQHLTTEHDLFLVDAKTRNEAYSLHLSPAKYLAILSLQEVDPTASVETCKHHSISELKEFTQQHRYKDEQNSNIQNDSNHTTQNGSTETESSDRHHSRHNHHGH